jgi:hypothetical protein
MLKNSHSSTNFLIVSRSGVACIVGYVCTKFGFQSFPDAFERERSTLAAAFADRARSFGAVAWHSPRLRMHQDGEQDPLKLTKMTYLCSHCASSCSLLSNGGARNMRYPTWLAGPSQHQHDKHIELLLR